MFIVHGCKFKNCKEIQLVPAKRYNKFETAKTGVIDIIEKYLNENGYKLNNGGLELEARNNDTIYEYGNILLDNCNCECNISMRIDEL